MFPSGIFTQMVRPVALALALGLAACSGQTGAQPAGPLGYGTPGVAAYLHDNEATSFQAQLERCRGISPQAEGQTQGLPAACGQLRRMYPNQPGNSVQPRRAP